MSNMDGIGDVSEYVDQALKWGHEAIALRIIMHFMHILIFINQQKIKNIKPIYGVELDFVR